MSFSIGSLFSTVGHAIASFFGSHQSAIQAAILDAQTAAGAATAVATVLGEPASVSTEIGKISNGLAAVSSAVTTEATADTLTQHATNLAGLVTTLVSSGDIGIKNAATQTAVAVMATKAQGVVGALELAASAAPAVAPNTAS